MSQSNENDKPHASIMSLRGDQHGGADADSIEDESAGISTEQIVQMLMLFAQSPGTQAVLEAYAKRIASETDLAKQREQHEHERAMDNQQRSWAQTSKNSTMGFWLMMLWSVLTSGLIIAAVVAIHHGLITKESAVTLGLLLTGLLGWLTSKFAPKASAN